jgi:hypothetical protein
MPPRRSPYYDLPAIRLKQNRKTIYLTSIAASDLAAWEDEGILFVDQWEERRLVSSWGTSVV